MTLWVKPVLILAAANAVSLAISAWLFDGLTVTTGWFIAAVGIFTVLGVAVRKLVSRAIPRYVRAYTIAGGLFLTGVSLGLTDLLVPRDGFSISGWGTWIGVIVIVWAAEVAYGEIDDQAPPKPAR